MTSQKIINLADPTNPQDLATKAYVDSVLGIPPAGIMMMCWGYHPPIGNLAAMRERFSFLKNIGINCILDTSHWWNSGFHNNVTVCTNYSRYFDEAKTYGIKIHMFTDARTIVYQEFPFIPLISADQGKPFVLQFKDKPAFGGHFLYDEPHCGLWYFDTDLKGDPAYHNPGAGRHYFGLSDAQIAEWWPYGLPRTRWIGYANKHPYGGHMLEKMAYEQIKGQDDSPDADHPVWCVWDHGFSHYCGGAEWENTYAVWCTPRWEIEDIGAVDIYPSPNNFEASLHSSIMQSYTLPGGDGFGQNPPGMIAVINTYSPNPGPNFLVRQYNVWKNIYGDKLKGVGFYDAATWMQNTDLGAEYRSQIKDVARLEGWGG